MSKPKINLGKVSTEEQTKEYISASAMYDKQQFRLTESKNKKSRSLL